MGKYKRNVVGSVMKSQDAGRPDYIKFSQDVSFHKGDYLSLESQKFQLDSLESAQTSGKLSAELADKIRDRLNKMPEFVRFELVKLEPK